MIDRKSLSKALSKPLPDCNGISIEEFDPWSDVIKGIYGGYSSMSDDLMIEALEATRDKRTFDFIDRRGFAGELALYILAGHGLTDYGTSPRGGWPNHEIKDLWQDLIDKWKAYAAIMWDDD